MGHTYTSTTRRCPRARTLKNSRMAADLLTCMALACHMDIVSASSLHGLARGETALALALGAEAHAGPHPAAGTTGGDGKTEPTNNQPTNQPANHRSHINQMKQRRWLLQAKLLRKNWELQRNSEPRCLSENKPIFTAQMWIARPRDVEMLRR